jgi:hypothetical protein
MFLIKNKEGLRLKVIFFPATPPYVALFSDVVSDELATHFHTEKDAHDEVKFLIEENDEPAEKFEGYSVHTVLTEK